MVSPSPPVRFLSRLLASITTDPGFTHSSLGQLQFFLVYFCSLVQVVFRIMILVDVTLLCNHLSFFFLARTLNHSLQGTGCWTTQRQPPQASINVRLPLLVTPPRPVQTDFGLGERLLRPGFYFNFNCKAGTKACEDSRQCYDGIRI